MHLFTSQGKPYIIQSHNPIKNFTKEIFYGIAYTLQNHQKNFIMKMQNVDIVRYPKFAHYVRTELSLVHGNKAIMAAMLNIGQLDRATLKRALVWNQGPEIKITALAGAVGEFTPGIGSNEIRINKTAVENFEAGRGISKTKSGKNVYLVGVTLLHELVHWGDDRDGIDRPGEEGAEFETTVYGHVVN